MSSEYTCVGYTYLANNTQYHYPIVIAAMKGVGIVFHSGNRDTVLTEQLPPTAVLWIKHTLTCVHTRVYPHTSTLRGNALR